MQHKPKNQQDKNAVAVVKDGEEVSHIARALASSFVKRIRYFDFNTNLLNTNGCITGVKIINILLFGMQNEAVGHINVVTASQGSTVSNYGSQNESDSSPAALFTVSKN